MDRPIKHCGIIKAYNTNIAILKIHASGIGARPGILARVAGQITENGIPMLRIAASDINTAKKELPRLVAASGLTLRRYELTPPSLEDIFIALVGGGR